MSTGIPQCNGYSVRSLTLPTLAAASWHKVAILTDLVNALKEVFYPEGGAPWVTAELLKIVD